MRYEGRYTYETFHGSQTIYFLRRVDNDAAVVWKTNGSLGYEADEPQRREDGVFSTWVSIEKGHGFTATFTIKSHDSYNGEQQTKVTRLVVADPNKPTAPKGRKRETKVAREQRLADEAERKATEARTKVQAQLDSAERCVEMLRANVAKAEVPGSHIAQYLDQYCASLAEYEEKTTALRAEIEAHS